MVSLQYVEEQLKRVGCNFRFWGRGEIKALRSILMPDETIEHAVNGEYEGGFAMLVVTDQRLLLVDHKPFFMTTEDIRYDMIAAVDYSIRILTSSIRIMTPSRPLVFRSWSHYHLKQLQNVIQAKMQELRQHYNYTAQQMQPTPIAATVDGQAVMGLMLGSMALQTGGFQRPLLLPPNPYMRNLPLLQRRRIYPRFY